MSLDNHFLCDINSIIRKELGKSMEPDSNNHLVFLLCYHLILVNKYRRKVINDAISNRLKEMFVQIQKNYNISLQEWNHDKDHMHILFKAHPNTELSKFINAYKSASSRIIKEEFPEIKQQLWKEYFGQEVSVCLQLAEHQLK